jgi:Fe-S-cluster containining protein
MSLPLLTTCDGCGACCRHMVAPPYVITRLRDESREKGVPDDLRAEFLPRWESRFYVPESPCCWYDERTARCRHYELRPDACRDFELGSPSCHATRQQWGPEASANASTD